MYAQTTQERDGPDEAIGHAVLGIDLRHARFGRDTWSTHKLTPMSRAARRQKAEEQLRSLEEQFATELVAALRECAAGTWGLFGQNDLVTRAEPQPVKESLKSQAAERLIEGGDKIEQLRRELGFTEPFPQFKRFLEFREMRGSHVPGEPKLAAQFLAELGAQ